MQTTKLYWFPIARFHNMSFNKLYESVATPKYLITDQNCIYKQVKLRVYYIRRMLAAL
jgi:hypothetical protein